MRRILIVLMFLILSACVDMMVFDISSQEIQGVSVSGLITDSPGPYHVSINSTFDIDSKESIKTPISVKHLILSDDLGTKEELNEVEPGSYVTSATGIQGEVGRVYTLRVEFWDGRIYESIPDTLMPPGVVDSVYFAFVETPTETEAVEYSFDIFTNASKGEGLNNQFMWSMVGTFKSTIDPEQGRLDKYGCNPQDNGKCNFYPLCTGLWNIGQGILSRAVFERVGPCECCTCWYTVFNNKPILSDDKFIQAEHFSDIEVYNVPLSGWIFMNQFHAEVRQFSLTKNAFRFWGAIRDQRNAIGNIFQPVNGKVPLNFSQLAGENYPVYGIFYAAGMSTKSRYITRDDVPSTIPIPTPQKPADVGSCLRLFPNASTNKPPFWVD